MMQHYQRAGRTFELETVEDDRRHAIMWRHPNGRRHEESFRAVEVFRFCLELVTEHVEKLGWRCVPAESPSDSDVHRVG